MGALVKISYRLQPACGQIYKILSAKLRGLTASLIVLARADLGGISSLLGRAERNFRPLATEFSRMHPFCEINF